MAGFQVSTEVHRLLFPTPLPQGCV